VSVPDVAEVGPDLWSNAPVYCPVVIVKIDSRLVSNGNRGLHVEIRYRWHCVVGFGGNGDRCGDLPRPQPVVQTAPVGKWPVGKTPVGKYPIGKAPAPLVTKG
jgi:hypothetical protein